MTDTCILVRMIYYTKPPSYPQTSNISGISIGNKIVDYSDVVGASPVGAAPTTSYAKTIARREKKHLNFLDISALYIRCLTVYNRRVPHLWSIVIYERVALTRLQS